MTMNRRTFFASLVGVAVVRAVPPGAPAPDYSFLDSYAATNAEIAACLRRMNAALDAARPTVTQDDLTRYVQQLTAEVHQRRDRHLAAAKG